MNEFDIDIDFNKAKQDIYNELKEEAYEDMVCKKLSFWDYDYKK